MDINNTRKCLADFDFKKLFVEELGWNHFTSRLEIPVDDKKFVLSAIAEKCGMAVFLCDGIPERQMRQKIERLAAKSAHEHIIVYSDGKNAQIWQWVKRETGKPVICREHPYYISQPGDSLIQKLQWIAFTLEDEECLTLPGVTSGARSAFDVERVTKRFYERFKDEHEAFLKFLKGIPDKQLERWYVSVMLNRLMFIYFIQKKGFLDNDQDYLRHKLEIFKREGKDRFYSGFLCPLFFEGFAKRPQNRSAEMNKFLGKVPYLNGGIFMPHQIEQLHGRTIEIPDKAFENLFEFFNTYQWHLDDRATKRDNEIRPDVLGYIFEKYINQKQMGAYYTKEDITGYISKNTVIPFLFGKAKERCKIAFEGTQSIWRLLREDPDKYIYPAVQHGIKLDIHQEPPKVLESMLPLPPEIAHGLDDVSKRGEWNKTAPSEYGLPTETWRELVARRKRYEELRSKLSAGGINDINDLITYNLDIWQFAQDVIENAEGPELIRAFWRALNEITILDPACGSGAFLFAALNILEPLYEACLDRMRVFVDEIERSGKKPDPKKYADFREILKRTAEHPNERYFILKTIVVNNLYGVDIMEEAIEICKLRLFLKLVAQIDKVEYIEPLPDIDFNIKAGNTLVGFTSIEGVKKTQEGTLGFGKAEIARIEEEADIADRAFQQFRRQQTELGGTVTAEDKRNLFKRLKGLSDQLDRYLASEYGINTSNMPRPEKYEKAFEIWHDSHKPFHWFTEFYGILKAGGFDVIIGNPPYLEIGEIDYELAEYISKESGAVHAMFMERGADLLNLCGTFSMIVPLSLPSTQRMKVVQNILESHGCVWFANYAWRPAKLFDTVNRALTIFVVVPSSNSCSFSTGYYKWTSDSRTRMFERLVFVEIPRLRSVFWIPKFGYSLEKEIFNKCLNVKTKISDFSGQTQKRIYYRTTGGLYWKVFTDFTPAFWLNGKPGHSTRETWFSVTKQEYVKSIIAILSSDVFWWWYTISTNLRDLNPYDIMNFYVPLSAVADTVLNDLGGKFLDDINRNSIMLVRQQKQTGRIETQSFKIQRSKPIIDEINRVLAKHYGFTDDELDFIINYDIKYRMGRETEAGDEAV